MDKVQELLEEAKKLEQRNLDRIARGDEFEDSGVSQWCDSLSAGKYRAQAEIEKNGGLSEFPALFNLEGKRVRAKLINGKYGKCWAFCNPEGEFTGKFISAFPKRTKTMEKKGYREGTEMAPAYACITGNGTGLSGLTTCFVIIRRSDKGYPENKENGDV